MLQRLSPFLLVLRLWIALPMLIVMAWVLGGATAQAERQSAIIVAQDHAWPPFSFADDQGRPQGLLIDLWQHLAADLERPLHFQLVEWQASLDLVRHGEAMVHGGLLQSPDRAEYMAFSEPLMPLSAFFFVSARAFSTDINDFRGTTIGLVRGGYEEVHMQEHHPDFKLRQFGNNRELVQAALAGELTAFVADYPVTLFLLNQLGSPNDFFAVKQLYEQPIRIGVANDQPELLAQINAAIARLDPEQLHQISHRWINTTTVEVEVMPHWLTWLLIMLAGLVLTLFLGLLWWQKQRLHRLLTRTVLELNDQELQYQTLVESAQDIIYKLSQTGDFLYLSPSATVQLGYPIDDLLHQPVAALVHPDDLHDCRQFLASVLSQTAPELGIEHRFRHQQGHYLWFRSSGSMLPGSRTFMGIGHNIDSDKQQALLQAEQQGLQVLIADLALTFVSTDAHSLDDSLQQLLRKMGQFFAVDRCFLLKHLTDPHILLQTHEWCRPGVAASSSASTRLSLTEFPWLQTQVERMQQQNSALFFNHWRQLPPEAHNEVQQLIERDIQALYLMPIVINQELVGFYGLAAKQERHWPKHLQHSMAIVASLLSDATQRVRTEEVLTKVSLTDPLTGLGNRRQLSMQLQSLLRGSSNFCLLLIDVDHFKDLNDRYGHLAGDEVLKQLARCLEHSFRQHDHICRYGGEEFVILLKDIRPEIAKLTAQRFLQAVATQRFEHEEQLHRVTVSAGLVCRDEYSGPVLAETLLKQADERLYQAKEQGRNRLVSAQPVE